MYILWGFLGTIALVVILFIGLTIRKAGRNRKGQAQTAPAAPAKKTNLAWIGWLVAIVLVAVGVNWGYRRYYKETQTPPIAAPARAERVIETIAPVGRWSENISIPLLHWFRIVPEGKVRIRLWNGREMDSEPGNDTWFGDNILDANFRFMSRETGDVKVKVVMRPK